MARDPQFMIRHELLPGYMDEHRDFGELNQDRFRYRKACISANDFDDDVEMMSNTCDLDDPRHEYRTFNEVLDAEAKEWYEKKKR